MANKSRIANVLPSTPPIIPVARMVPFDAPWVWLAAGWRDMWTVPFLSLAYGGAFALAAAALLAGLARREADSLFLALAGGFLLIGPLLAVGLYEASRQLANGQRPQLGDVAFAWLGARGQLGFFGAILMFLYLVWLQLAFLLLMLFVGNAGPPSSSSFMQSLLLTQRGLGLLVVGTLVGGALAACVFAISAFAVPLLLRHEIDAVTAARASAVAVAGDPRPMLLWAGLIVLIMAAGFATLLVGLAIAFPLIGHATWHAYVDVFSTAEQCDSGFTPVNLR